MFNKLKKESQAMADELKKLTTEIEAAEKLAEVSNRYNLYSSILQNTHNHYNYSYHKGIFSTPMLLLWWMLNILEMAAELL